jgi:hypothetical protein
MGAHAHAARALHCALRSCSPRLACAALPPTRAADTVKAGAARARPVLRELYETRAGAYRDGVREFVVGYREAFRETLLQARCAWHARSALLRARSLPRRAGGSASAAGGCALDNERHCRRPGEKHRRAARRAAEQRTAGRPGERRWRSAEPGRAATAGGQQRARRRASDKAIVHMASRSAHARSATSACARSMVSSKRRNLSRHACGTPSTPCAAPKHAPTKLARDALQPPCGAAVRRAAKA